MELGGEERAGDKHRSGVKREAGSPREELGEHCTQNMVLLHAIAAPRPPLLKLYPPLI